MHKNIPSFKKMWKQKIPSISHRDRKEKNTDRAKTNCVQLYDVFIRPDFWFKIRFSEELNPFLFLNPKNSNIFIHHHKYQLLMKRYTIIEMTEWHEKAIVCWNEMNGRIKCNNEWTLLLSWPIPSVGKNLFRIKISNIRKNEISTRECIDSLVYYSKFVS